jgi:hypothetical protein
MPADTPDEVAPAWLSCLVWAVGEPSVLAAFRLETGNEWSPGRTALDKMIDDAVGADDNFARAFVKWFNENVWGPMDGTEP